MNKTNNDFLNTFNDIKVNIKLSDDKTIKALNKQYLGRNYTTDVLSFEIKEKFPDGSFYLGDIIVNVDQAKRQADKYENSVEEEIAQLVEHGILHLLGVHHEDDDEISVHGKRTTL